MLFVADQQIGHAVAVADLEHRHVLLEERRHVADRLELHLADAERDHRRRMAVHDGVDVGPRLVDFAVDEALDVHEPPGLIDRIGIEVVLHDVGGGDDRRRLRARQEIAVRRMGMADRHMAVAVEHALVGEDAVRRDEVLDRGGVDRAAGLRGDFWSVMG